MASIYRPFLARWLGPATILLLAVLILVTPRPGHAATVLDGNGVVAQALNNGALIDPDTSESPSSFSGNDLTNHGPNDDNLLLTAGQTFHLFDVPFFTFSGIDYFGFIPDGRPASQKQCCRAGVHRLG